MAALSPEVRELLDAPNFVHLSTLRKDGAPRNWVVWVGLEGDRILVCTSTAQLKALDMRRDPRVALSVTANDNPYRMAVLQGRVVEERPDHDLPLHEPDRDQVHEPSVAEPRPESRLLRDRGRPGRRANPRLSQHPGLADQVAVGMVGPADRVTMLRVRVPLQPPAAVHVAVVPPPPEDHAARERGDERDVRQRPADEVVAAVGRPVDDAVKGGEHEITVVVNGRSLRLSPAPAMIGETSSRR
jgi:PPOX class probable F420-dependent enzyme